MKQSPSPDAARPSASIYARAVTVLLACALQTGCMATKGPIPLARVELGRMYGGWYIVGTIPNFLERGVVGGYDLYSPGLDGGIREDFYMQRGGFNAAKRHYSVDIDVMPGSGNADWRVRPVWPLRLPFQIYYVDPDYRFALFGEQNRDWGWIYSRTPLISDSDYQALIERFKALGYDTTRFRRVIQTREQIGKSGFWSDGVEVPKRQ